MVIILQDLQLKAMEPQDLLIRALEEAVVVEKQLLQQVLQQLGVAEL